MVRIRNLTIFSLCMVFALGSLAIAGEKPSFDLDWYGYVKLDAAYDNHKTSHGNFVMWSAIGKENEQFNMTANQTRFGLKANGKNYKRVNVFAQVEFDLYGSPSGATVAQNKAMLQLRHAYFSLQYDNFKLNAGQTSDIISPLNPSTLNYSVMWGIGNMGYRRPQISMYYTAQASEMTSVTFGGGFFRTIGNDLTPTFSLAAGETSDGEDDGTDAAIPSVQGIMDVKHKFESGASVRFGVSGLFGRLKTESNMGSFEEYESWGMNGHVDVKASNSFGFKGEAFSGSNLGSYFGGILNSNTVEGIEAVGGWGALWFKTSPKVALNLGVGVDDPKDEDLSNGSRSYNQMIYGNVNYSIVPQVVLGLEVGQVKTDYIGSDETSKSLRFQTAMTLKF